MQEILFGGAAGGGKSHLARVVAITLCAAIPGFQFFLFRRTYKDLYLSHYVGPNCFRVLLHEAIEAGDVSINDLEIKFSNGSRIHGCHCQHEHDVYNYKSVEMHGRCLEETTEFTPFQIQYLGTRARYPKSLVVPAWAKKLLPFALYPTNPGGDAHDYLIEEFNVLEYLSSEEYKAGKPSKKFVKHASARTPGKTRMFIPSRLDDNPDLDPEEYIASLEQLRHPEMVRALRDGDWTVKLGALLPEISRERCVVPHFTPPPHWTRRRAFDWGSNAPAAALWAAISDGETQPNGVILPRGSLYIYKEWLVAQASDKTKGLGYSNAQLAEGMYTREDGHNIPYLTDTLPFQARGGVPMWKDFLDHGITLKQADVSSKKVSVQAVRSLAKAEQLYFSDECPEILRTIQNLQPRKNDSESPADHPEDHLPDCLFHIARDWVNVQDKVTSDAERIQEDLNRVDTLTDVMNRVNSELD